MQKEYISSYNGKEYITTANSIYEGQCKAMEIVKKEYPRRKIYGNDLGTMLNTKENIEDQLRSM